MDVEAVAREAEDRGRKAMAQEFATAMRAMIADSPMPGPPNPGTLSGIGAYHWDNPIHWSTPQPPNRRPGSIVDVNTLRRLADTYDILRACIQHLKREVAAVPMQITPKQEKDDSDSTKRRIKDVRAFFNTSGGLGGFGKLRSEFEGEVIEDLSVIGAAALFYHPTLGGWPYEVIALDAATIRPRVDAWGWPGPGEEIYEQWVMGIKVTGFTRELLSYRGLSTNSRTYSPYYWSPVEWLIYVVQSALRADEWNRRWLTDGNTPADIVSLPETWTPGQVREFAEWWDALLAGNTPERVKTKFAPSGTKLVANSKKDQEFQEYELWLLRRTCAIIGVQPASIGFAGEQYKVTQEESMNSTSAFGVGILLDWRKATYDDLLERMGYGELEVQNITAKEEKATERAERLVKLTGGVGVITPNEARAEEGKEPIDGGDVLFVPTTVQPLDLALEPPEPAPMPGSGPPKPDEKRAALQQWERKALKRIRAGQGAACRFESAHIPDDVRQRIEEGLPGCTTREQVAALFRGASEPKSVANLLEEVSQMWQLRRTGYGASNVRC